MSAESAHHINEKRAVPMSAHSRRPATRIAFGILVAIAYAGILAGAGFFISGAVNSMNENTAVARATIEAFRETPHDAATSGTSGSSEAQAAQTAAEPWRPPVAPPLAPPRDAAPAATEAPPVAAIPPAAPADSPRDDAAPAGLPHPDAALPAAAPPPADLALAHDFATRGDERLRQGDVASARLFYERAADAGDAQAARHLANSFDPAFLARWGVRFMRGDPAEATRWYRRAVTLGDSEAAQDLAALPRH
jgi:hypothetical protein